MNLTQLLDGAVLDARFPLPLDAPFTTATARREGVRPAQLRQLVALGFLRRPIRGVYVAAQVGDSTDLRCRMLSLIVPEDAVVCDRHAAWLLGSPMSLAPGEHMSLRPISLYRPSGRGRVRQGLADAGERNLTRADVTEVGGVRVTTALRTACDLGRVRWTDEAIAGMDAVLRLGTVSRAQLVGEVERFRGMRWVTTLRAIAPLTDGRSESPGESVLRLRWIEARLPAPVPQHPIWTVDGEFVARLDLAAPELRYGAEYDGAEWHSSPSQHAHDRERRASVGEEGWHVDAFVAAQVYGRDEVASSVMRRGLERARHRYGSRVVRDSA